MNLKEKVRKLRKLQNQYIIEIDELNIKTIMTYPGDDEEERYLESIGAICLDRIIMFNLDGYSSKWAVPDSRYEEVQRELARN